MKIPKVSSEQMREIDKLMIKYQITPDQMMENAGRNLASFARSNFLNGDVLHKKVLILAGTGENGGTGLVATRFLYNWGAEVVVLMTKSINDLEGASKHQALILENIGIPLHITTPLTELEFPFEVDLILDAIIGYSLSDEPKGNAAILIKIANKAHVPILSLDIPSGMDATTGTTYGELTIKATATMTLGLPKTGLYRENARDYVGDLYLADIGIPVELFKELDMEIPDRGIFHKGSILKLRNP